MYMPYTVQFGPKGHRQITAVKLNQTVETYENLTAAGEINVQIISPSGEPVTVEQFELDLHSGFG